MNEEYYNLEVEFADRIDTVEITLHYTWENDGIGAYEYWGSKGYDRGHDYKELHKVTYDTTYYSKEDIEAIEATIDNDWELITETINK